MLTLCSALAVLASCAPTIEPDACAGWRKITIGAATVDWLNAHDRGALRGIIGHAEFGAARGCW
jgi:hypothetical protein